MPPYVAMSLVSPAVQAEVDVERKKAASKVHRSSKSTFESLLSGQDIAVERLFMELCGCAGAKSLNLTAYKAHPRVMNNFSKGASNTRSHTLTNARCLHGLC